jgi:hypothetical protein
MKVSLENLKRIVLEEAVALSEADHSSSAGDFDSPAKLKKLRKLALTSIESLPIDHPDLERHVNDLMMRLQNASTEEQLHGVHKAAVAWHRRAAELMGWIHRGEYQQSPEMTESNKDGTRRKSLKDILDHIRTEDVIHTTTHAWAGGGDKADNLVAPVDQLKRQTGISVPEEPEFMDVSDEDASGGDYPALPIADEIKEGVQSLSTMGRYSPEDQLADWKPFSPMTSLAERDSAFDPADQTVDDIVSALEARAREEGAEEPERAVENWARGEVEDIALDAFLASYPTTYARNDLQGYWLEGEVATVGGEQPPVGEELILGTTEEVAVSESIDPRWLEMAGILNG